MSSLDDALHPTQSQECVEARSMRVGHDAADIEIAATYDVCTAAHVHFCALYAEVRIMAWARPKGSLAAQGDHT